MDKGPWRDRGRGEREREREREGEHGWCFAARSFLIDESGPRGALKANRYSFFPPCFFSPYLFFLTVRFVADSDKTMAEQNKRGLGGRRMCMEGTPPDHFSLGVPEDCSICVFLYVCVCRRV